MLNRILFIIYLLLPLFSYSQSEYLKQLAKKSTTNILKSDNQGNMFNCVIPAGNDAYWVAGFYNNEYDKRISIVARHLSNGKLDRTLRENGTIQFQPIENRGSEVIDMALQRNGMLAILGTTQNSIDDNAYNIYLTRFYPDGEFDMLFIQREDTGAIQIINDGISTNGSSEFSTNEKPLYTEAKKLLLLPDGKYLVFGTSIRKKDDVNYEDGESFVTRIMADGSYDESFGDKGFVHFNLTPKNDLIEDAILMKDGSILILGKYNFEYSKENTSDDGDIFVAKLSVNGAIDNSFGKNGFRILDYNEEENIPVKFLLLPNGNILIIGKTIASIEGTHKGFHDLVLFRLNNDGYPDQNFGNNGVKTINIMGIDIPTDAKLTKEGKIIIIGNEYNTLAEYLEAYKDLSDSLIHYPFTEDELKERIYNSFYMRIDQDGNIDSTLHNLGVVFSSCHEFNEHNRVSSFQIINDAELFMVGTQDINDSSKFLIITSLLNLNIGELACTNDKEHVFAYPNPVKDNATVVYSLCQDEKISISLINLEGKIVHQFLENTSRTKGEQHELLTIPSQIPDGAYMIVIESNVNTKAIKIIVQR